MLEIQKLSNLFLERTKIVLIGHYNPDGDAVGSMIAMGAFLESYGCEVTLITPNEPAGFLSGISSFDKICCFNNAQEKLRTIVLNAEIIFFMDFNEIDSRIGKLSNVVAENNTAKRVLVDHHLNANLDSFDYAFSDTSYSSTALLVLDIINQTGRIDKMNKASLEAIYVGMMTDTGNFSYGNLSPHLYRSIALLVEKGVDTVEVNASIFNVKSENSLRLNAYAISNKMVVVNPTTAYISLTQGELNRFSYRQGDIDGLVNVPLSIKGITFSALFIETNECIKISFRSRGNDAIDVNMFARTHFVGGGHKNASGAKSFTDMAKAIDSFISAL